ncbi:hypothetical protein GGR56DRAFT_616048 [Xylariaceae sp. FL0804]|nr:hypothetical protein GGR56DRAFT_616048 [Xylariaceae sp. FL0804]
MGKTKPGLAASKNAVDPTLEALFAGSAGPVKAPSVTRYSDLLSQKEHKPGKLSQDAGSGPGADLSDDDEEHSEVEEAEDDESLSEIEAESESLEDEDTEGEDVTSQGFDTAPMPPPAEPKDRKRKRKDAHEDLEDKYMRKLAREEEEDDRRQKRVKGETTPASQNALAKSLETAGQEEDDEPTLVHESLQKTDEHGDVELEKANRTLFLGNVSTEAISSSKAKKLLTSHLESPLPELDQATGPHKVESLRFRSVAFSAGGLPKRAAFITKSLMSATTKSTNAYAVFSSPLAARTALRALNGSVVLDRHIRVDSVAHPTAIDHRRCVFVGNLGFVDDETVFNIGAEGETTTKKRTKVPADTEEGLWRVFGQHAGKVESVRVPRDEKTRVGKGFAYVQFYDGNDVETALLLNEKKFPPMLPRALRVSRAKDPRKTALAAERTTKAKAVDAKPKSTKYKPKITPEQQSQVGRAGRLFGRVGAAQQRHALKSGGKRPEESRGLMNNDNNFKSPEEFVFEGRRASSKDGRPRDLKFGKAKGKKGTQKTKPKDRGARRAAAWRKKGANS